MGCVPPAELEFAVLAKKLCSISSHQVITRVKADPDQLPRQKVTNAINLYIIIHFSCHFPALYLPGASISFAYLFEPSRNTCLFACLPASLPMYADISMCACLYRHLPCTQQTHPCHIWFHHAPIFLLPSELWPGR